jgi:acetylornithine aminotransferase/acetylornithine/N-succinyldiaminopimelate aminotransferase
MTVGNAVLDIVLKEGFFDHVRRVNKYLKDKLLLLAEEFPRIISEIRGEVIYRSLHSAHRVYLYISCGSYSKERLSP